MKHQLYISIGLCLCHCVYLWLSVFLFLSECVSSCLFPDVSLSLFLSPMVYILLTFPVSHCLSDYFCSILYVFISSFLHFFVLLCSSCSLCLSICFMCVALYYAMAA